MAPTAAQLSTFDTDDEVVVETIPMSYEEYLAWAAVDEANNGEWVDGEVIPFMSTSERHAIWVTFLIRLIGGYLDLRDSGRIYSQTFELRSRPDAAREPDVLVVLNEHLDRLEDMRLVGAADLVVEVISPDSVLRDTRQKFDEYETAGVREYWLVDPRPRHRRFRLFSSENGRFVEVLPDAAGRVASSVLPGVWFDPIWVTTDDLPNPTRLAIEMARTAD